MAITSLVRSTGFRLAALTAGAFGIGALIYSGIVYYGVRASMEQQLRERISAETAYLVGDYEDNGIDELRHDIGERLERAPSSRLYYTVTNAEGAQVFDRLEHSVSPGWSRVTRAGKPDLLVLSTELRDGFRLGVAAEARSIDEFGQALRRTTLLQLLALMLIGAGVGSLLSRRFMVRIEHLRRTAEAVGRGHLSERIPLEGRHDDFEQVAIEINRMLVRIEDLVETSRRVTSDIAHDLRTPLGVVRQKLESLREHALDPASRALCDESLQGLDGALETFAALLRIAELESGRSPLPLEAIDVSALLAHLHEAYEPTASERSQSLELDVEYDVKASGDRALITQLVVNLVENAIHHNGAGVRIRLVSRRLPGGSRIEVRDDGVGIPETLMAEVVKPFYRVDRTRRTPGSGLGLCLAARIAERHGTRLQLSDAAPGLVAAIDLRKD